MILSNKKGLSRKMFSLTDSLYHSLGSSRADGIRPYILFCGVIRNTQPFDSLLE